MTDLMLEAFCFRCWLLNEIDEDSLEHFGRAKFVYLGELEADVLSFDSAIGGSGSSKEIVIVDVE